MANFTPIGVEAVVRGLPGFTAQLGTMSTAIRGTGEAADSVGGRFVNLGNNVLNFGAAAAKVAAGALVALGTSLAGIGVASVKMASDFDTAMRNVNAIAQLPEKQFQELSDEVLDFSLTTRASSTDVANALYNVVSAGLSMSDTVTVPITKVRELADGSKELYTDTLNVSEGMAVLQLASRAAGAGLATTEDTSRLLISAIRAYNLDMAQAGDVTDLFLYTVNKGLTTLPELSTDLGRVLPTAHAAGISIEELTAATALLTQKGLSTSEATTALNSAFVAILKPSTALQEVFEDAGYSSGVAAVQSLGFAGVMQLLAGSTGEAADEVAAMFGNIRAQRAVFNLVTDDAAELNAMIKDFSDNAAGAVERARIEQYKSFSAQLAKLKGAFEVIGITIGKAILPYLTELVEKLQPIIVDFGKKLPDAIKSTISQIKSLIMAFQRTGIRGLASALGMSPEVLGTIDRALASVSSAIRFVIEHWEAFKGALIAVGAILAGAAIAAAIAAIGAAIATLLSPISLIIIAAAALGAAWQTNFMGIRDTLTQFWESTARPILEQLLLWLQANIPIAIQTLSAFWSETLLPAIQVAMAFFQEQVIPALVQVAMWLGTNIPIAIQALSEFWTGTLLPAITVAIGFIRDQLIPALVQVGLWLGTNVPIAIQVLSEFWTGTLLPAITVAMGFIRDQVIPALIQVGLWLGTNIPLAIQAVSEFWTGTLLPAITVAIGFIRDQVIPALVQVGLWLGTNVPIAIQALSVLWTGTLLPAIQSVAAFFTGTVFPLLAALANVWFAAVSKAVQFMVAIFRTFLLPVLQDIGAGLEILGGIIVVLAEVGIAYLSTEFQKLVTLINDTVIPIVTTLGGMVLAGLAQAFEDIKEVIGFVTSQLNAFAEAVNKIELPEFLQPGSPTPFEQGLQGIATALERVSAGPLTSFSKKALKAFDSVGSSVSAILTSLTGIPAILVTTGEEVSSFASDMTFDLEDASNAVGALASSFDGVASAVNNIANRAGNAADNIDDIGDAGGDIEGSLIPILEDLVSQLVLVRDTALEAALAVSDIGFAMSGTQVQAVGAQAAWQPAALAVAQAVPGGGERGINLTIGPNVINNGMDQAEFEARVEKTVFLALAGA